MKKLTVFISLFIFSLSVSSQIPQEDYSANFNGFQRTKGKYPDSAIKYMQKLAATRPQAAEMLLHDSFAQSFLSFMEEKITKDTGFLVWAKQMNMTIDSVRATMRKEKKIAYIILNELSKDPDTLIKSNVYPIAKWVEAEENTQDPKKLLTIGQNYLGYLSGSDDLYAQRKARYGLLISKLMYAHEELRPSADKILQYIYNKLQHNQVPGLTDLPKKRGLGIGICLPTLIL